MVIVTHLACYLVMVLSTFYLCSNVQIDLVGNFYPKTQSPKLLSFIGSEMHLLVNWIFVRVNLFSMILENSSIINLCNYPNWNESIIMSFSASSVLYLHSCLIYRKFFIFNIFIKRLALSYIMQGWLWAWAFCGRNRFSHWCYSLLWKVWWSCWRFRGYRSHQCAKEVWNFLFDVNSSLPKQLPS